MRCEEVHALIKPYHEQTLDGYTRIKIHHHLADCQSCTAAYDMWLRGEELISLPNQGVQETEATFSSGLLKNVMSRIEEEEKWANPSVKKSIPLASRFKLVLTFLIGMLLVGSLLATFSAWQQKEEALPEHVIRLDMMGDSWKIDEVVHLEQELAASEELAETSMEFQVVASLSDPIVYTLSEEKKEIPYLLIYTILLSLMAILGFSWITRTG